MPLYGIGHGRRPNGDKSNSGRSALPLAPSCRSEIGLIPFRRTWPGTPRDASATGRSAGGARADARAPSFLRVSFLRIRSPAREVAVVNCPRGARQIARNSIWEQPGVALACRAVSPLAPRPWNYYSPAKNPCARVLRRKTKKPARGVCANQNHIETYAQSPKPFSNPLPGATRKRIAPRDATLCLQTTSGETRRPPEQPPAADFLSTAKKSQPKHSPCPDAPVWHAPEARGIARSALLPNCLLTLGSAE